MKRPLSILPAVALLILSSACTTHQPVTDSRAATDSTEVAEERRDFDINTQSEVLTRIDPSSTLLNHLRRVPGLDISVNGFDYNIIIRGYKFIDPELSGRSENVLFVVNNIPVGHSYSEAESLISMENVVEIRVYKGNRALTRFGHRGVTGAIEIITD